MNYYKKTIVLIVLTVLVFLNCALVAADAPVHTEPTKIFEMELTSGMNLISLPLIPVNNNTGAVLGNNTIQYSAVLKYNASSNQFEDVTTGTMDVGVGYFVNITSAGTWKYEGIPYSQMQIRLHPGLNMIGWVNYSKNITSALSYIEDKYRYIARWNASLQSFEVYNPHAPDNFNQFTTIDRGVGYFISTINEETLIVALCKQQCHIASFNIQVFGRTKANKPEVMENISKIIRNFDLVAIQEIRDVTQTAVVKLNDTINHEQKHKYTYIMGERLGRTSSKEQYAYFYNTSTIELIGSPYTYPEAPYNDMFHREPYIANFKVKNGSFDFVLITIHTDPDEATQEINYLPEVVEDTKNTFGNESNFIILGDLNADCRYFDENGESPLKSSDYFWVINNSLDTTTKSTVCTYDRIIITTETVTDYTKDCGVFRFDEVYNLTYEETIAVSDHYPVYAAFYTGG
ncbi:Metal-dependent hydrolase, endonuclease/exonuclease/phosphatase family [Candidatus Methanomarinus sp.]|nr:Metal-dependent hydrolase, endonuclease/exonuclease/phosphatase family [ANME-2 cluster archaeon]